MPIAALSGTRHSDTGTRLMPLSSPLRAQTHTGAATFRTPARMLLESSMPARPTLNTSAISARKLSSIPISSLRANRPSDSGSTPKMAHSSSLGSIWKDFSILLIRRSTRSVCIVAHATPSAATTAPTCAKTEMRMHFL